MDNGVLVALAGVAVLLLVTLCALLAMVVSGRRRVQLALEDARSEADMLRSRLEQVEASRAVAATLPVVPQAEYVITSAGTPTSGTANGTRVPDRVVLSATLGEPLVKLVAFGYGVRRAMSAESRNRIAFEMRREVKRARKQRRRDTKDALREARRREAAA